MSIEEFIGKRHVNISQLARDIGYSRAHVQGVLDGRYKAGKKLAKALENISQGKIKAEEVMEFSKKRKGQKKTTPENVTQDQMIDELQRILKS